MSNTALSQIARARRAAEADSIRAADKADLAIWVFCVWCGHAQLAEGRWLVAQVKDPPNLLDELERRLRCYSCHRHGVRLIPTDRTLASFERMT